MLLPGAGEDHPLASGVDGHVGVVSFIGVGVLLEAFVANSFAGLAGDAVEFTKDVDGGRHGRRRIISIGDGVESIGIVPLSRRDRPVIRSSPAWWVQLAASAWRCTPPIPQTIAVQIPIKDTGRLYFAICFALPERYFNPLPGIGQISAPR